MNNALLFHMKLSVKNTFKQTLKRPLKTIGIIIAIIYFSMIPFMLKDMIEQFNLDNVYGFVLINSGITLYLTMPTTLTYFKRNGVNFTKPDVNFMFASPISPKQVLFYGLIKQAYLKVMIQIVAIIAAIFIFKISVSMALIYGLFSLIFSSVLEYSLAMIMYASEKLSDKNKTVIRYLVYVMLLLVTILLIFQVYKEGFSMDAIYNLMTHPIVLLTPIFGWKLGLLNLFFIEANIYTVLSTVLYVVSAIALLIIAYRMKVVGEYYEDGIKFTEDRAKLLEKKGNVSFSEAFGKKQKVHKYKGELKGSGSQVIFFKQFIELKRVRPFFITFGDLFLIVISIGAGIMFREGVEPTFFYMMISGVAIYISLFFQPNKKWKEEFTHYYMYLIPDSNWKKLWYSTLLQLVHGLIQAIIFTIPAAIIMRVSLFEVVMAIFVQVMIKTMMTYKALVFEGYVANKLGVNVAQFASLFLSVILIIVPGILIGLSTFIGVELSTTAIIFYCGFFSFIFMYLCTKSFTNIENLK